MGRISQGRPVNVRTDDSDPAPPPRRRGKPKSQPGLDRPPPEAECPRSGTAERRLSSKPMSGTVLIDSMLHREGVSIDDVLQQGGSDTPAVEHGLIGTSCRSDLFPAFSNRSTARPSSIPIWGACSAPKAGFRHLHRPTRPSAVATTGAQALCARRSACRIAFPASGIVPRSGHTPSWEPSASHPTALPAGG